MANLVVYRGIVASQNARCMKNDVNNTESKDKMDRIYGCLGKGMFWSIICVFGLAALGAIFGNDEDDESSSSSSSSYVEFASGDDTDADGKPAIPFSNPANPKSKTAPNPYAELEHLTGMADVKEQVITFANFIRVQKEREAKGLKSPDISYHCVFTGNPGTGKTTVARILAAIYRDLGVVSKGHLVETDRSGLIGEYVGTTAPKVNHLCDSAYGGVLFIDEAYALCTGSQQDYGPEAIATLLKRMEDDRDNLVVIVAGYPAEMETFLESNPGLRSRFNNYIDFPDFTAEELYTMFLSRAADYDYRLTDEAQSFVCSHMISKVAENNRNFGNARYVRNLFEKCITAHSNRVAKMKNHTTDDLSLMKKEDIEAALKAKK